MNQRPTTEFVTVPEAVRRSGLGLRQFRRAIRWGELPAYDVGGWPRLRWSEVLAFVESKRRTAPDQRGTRTRPGPRAEPERSSPPAVAASAKEAPQ